MLLNDCASATLNTSRLQTVSIAFSHHLALQMGASCGVCPSYRSCLPRIKTDRALEPKAGRHHDGCVGLDVASGAPESQKNRFASRSAPIVAWQLSCVGRPVLEDLLCSERACNWVHWTQCSHFKEGDKLRWRAPHSQSLWQQFAADLSFFDPAHTHRWSDQIFTGSWPHSICLLSTWHVSTQTHVLCVKERCC